MTNYLHEVHLCSTLDALRSGTTSLHDYVNMACDRIDQVDAAVEALLPEPGRRTRLLAEAADLQALYPDPARRPPLYGMLVGVKDIFHVDGFVTRAGSQIPPELFAAAEATCVQQLRTAGALLVGKTVTTEFAYFEPGPTRNPHNLAHTPGGSSSGSAAAVAAGLCGLALGTQTIGSVIRPAAFCGIVGFKPTYNRIATQGLVYFSRSVDHVGLFTQDVAGMQRAAAVLCQGWRADIVPATLPVLGVPDGPYLLQADEEARRSFENSLLHLQNAGCVVQRVPTLPNIHDLNQLHRRLAFAEFAHEHRTMYPQFADLYRPRTAEAVATGLTIGSDELAVGRANCAELRAQLEQQMKRSGIDLWVCPSAIGAAPQGIHATGDPSMNLPWTHVGMPAVTIPTGQQIDGLPLGLQLVAHYGQDEALLGWAQKLADLFSNRNVG